MPVVQVNHVFKTYAARTVVNDVSFAVNDGEIFGLIGPNGAGKTTAIRMMMDIIKPDAGTIDVLGKKLDDDAKARIGYLPEERGLYRKLTVLETIQYLGSLKGLPRETIAGRAEPLLKRTGLLAHKNKRIEELSKGMGQLVQFIVTVVHDPELVILDEPFSGLDPVNTELLRELIEEMRQQGKAVIFSTHQMNQVEELCDRLLMVDRGRAVLYGSLKEIRAGHRSHSVIVECEGELPNIPGVAERRRHKEGFELSLDETTEPQRVLEWLVAARVPLSRFEIGVPSLNEIFLEVAGKHE